MRFLTNERRRITRPHLSAIWNRGQRTVCRKQVRTPGAPSSEPAGGWQHGPSDIKERSAPLIDSRWLIGAEDQQRHVLALHTVNPFDRTTRQPSRMVAEKHDQPGWSTLEKAIE